MEPFHCTASIDDDQEGEWREILQKWDEHALSAAHSDDHQGLNINIGSVQQPTCTSMLNAHSTPAMESSNPNFRPLNPNFDCPSSVSLINQTPQSLSLHTPNSNQTLISLEAAVIDHLNSSAANLTTMDADNLIISTVRQQDETTNNLRSSWFSTFLQSLQSHPLAAATGLASSSSSYNNLLSTGGDDQRGIPTAASAHSNLMYSNQPGLDVMMEQMSNDFITYGAAGSLQEQLSNALSASDMMMNRTELMTGSIEGTSMSTVAGSNDRAAAGTQSTLPLTPASSVSSDGGPDDDSSSHEDMKDTMDMSHRLDPFDDLMMQSAAADNPHLNIATLPSAETCVSSQAKLPAAESSAAPTSLEQDKKRGSKSARVTKKPKRERGAKLAIKIQSEVEVLDDGYKWRKYGQKAVKNSPYPRSYYKCTDKQCKVKKHVERQAHERDYVVVTYEGVHNHSRPDQQLQVFHSQSDTIPHPHDSFQAFMPTPSTHHLSPLEILGLRPSTLFLTESQQTSLPLPQTFPITHHPLEPIDQGILPNLFDGGEPKRSSI